MLLEELPQLAIGMLGRLSEIRVLVLAEEVRLQPAAALRYQGVAIGAYALELRRTQSVHAALGTGTRRHSIRALGGLRSLETNSGPGTAEMQFRGDCVCNCGKDNNRMLHKSTREVFAQSLT